MTDPPDPAVPPPATPPRDQTADLTDHLTIPLHEEVLDVTRRATDLGAVVVRTQVETVPVEETIDLARDEVTVERVAVNAVIATAPRPRYEGETLVVPVVEEEVVVHKRLVLREELRITRRRTTESRVVTDTVRREVVTFEERAATPVSPTDPVASNPDPLPA